LWVVVVVPLRHTTVVVVVLPLTVVLTVLCDTAP
jgi:hypothetical protein